MAIKLMMSDEKPKGPVRHQQGASVETLLRAVLRRLDKKIEEKDTNKLLTKKMLALLLLGIAGNAVLTLIVMLILIIKGAH